MIRFAPSSHGKPQVGHVLLSEPFLTDAFFGRKAVLLCEHNNEGSFGFVLNNFVDIQIGDLLDDIKAWNGRISLGGPVKNSNLYYLHSRPDIPDCIPVIDGLFMGGNFDWIKEAIRAGSIDHSELRFFIGYAGWTEGQLTDEIRSKSWFITQTDVGKIMDTSIGEDEFWKLLIQGMGDDFSHIANSPIDPNLN